MIVQDRAFNPDGAFLEFLNPRDVRIRKGNTVLVNGAITPKLETHAQMIRFRILNASNGRIYHFGFSDNRDFYQIGSDGGLLQAPLAMQRLRLAPAERAEIIVDFGNDNGKTVKLMSYASELSGLVPPVMLDAMDTTDYDIMTFEVGVPTTTPPPVTSLPGSLIAIEKYDINDAWNRDNPRSFLLNHAGRLMSISGETMNMNVINHTINLGDTEVWKLSNESGQAHPFHIHGAPFQVLSRHREPLADNEKGWKDTILILPRDTVYVIKPFLDFADPVFPFMYHCHILEHEDLGMMGQFVVVDNTTSAGEQASSPPETLILRQNYPNPFNPTTRIVFGLPSDTNIRLTVFDLQGREVDILAEGHYSPGLHTAIFHAANLASGLYIYQLETPTLQLTNKLLVINTHFAFMPDSSREEDADEIVMRLREWREGNGPFELEPNTPIVLLGDLNERSPSAVVARLIDGDIFDEARFGEDAPPDWDGSSMTDLNSTQNADTVNITTSRNGRAKLDYILYTDSAIEVGNNYVLHTRPMTEEDLTTYGLRAADTDSASDHLPTVMDIAAVLTVDVEHDLTIPNDFALFPAYPNPFNLSTTIRYTIAQASHVSLSVFDLRGRQVASLVDRLQSRGEYSLTFDGGKLASGVYFTRIEAGSFAQSIKIVLMK